MYWTSGSWSMQIISTYYKRNEDLGNLFIFSQGLVARSHSLLVFHHYIHSHTTHSFMTFVEFCSSFFFLIAVGSGMGVVSQSCWTEIRLGAALQQPDALPTEPRRSLELGHATPSTEPRRTLNEPCRTLNEPRRTLNWAMPHPKLSHAAP